MAWQGHATGPALRGQVRVIHDCGCAPFKGSLFCTLFILASSSYNRLPERKPMLTTQQVSSALFSVLIKSYTGIHRYMHAHSDRAFCPLFYKDGSNVTYLSSNCFSHSTIPYRNPWKLLVES
jgi:hypothetical protein